MKLELEAYKATPQGSPQIGRGSQAILNTTLLGISIILVLRDEHLSALKLFHYESVGLEMTHIQSLAISKVSDVIHFFNPELEMKFPLKLSHEITSYDWDLRPRGCLISRDETPLKVPGLSSLSMNL